MGLTVTLNLLQEHSVLVKTGFCLQVVARDDDQGVNGQLSYMLSGGNEEGAFALSSSGQLSLTRTLDRETQGKYVLLITAIDSGTTAAEAFHSLFQIICSQTTLK